MIRKTFVGAALTLALASCAGHASQTTAGAPPVPAPTPAAAQPTTPATTAVAGQITGDGMFSVPDEAAPGTYRTVVPAEGRGHCYYARLSGPDRVEDILLNNNADPGERITVKIEPGDAYFESKGCGTWTLRAVG